MLPKIGLILLCDLLRLEYAIQSQALLFRETRAGRCGDAAIELHTVPYLNSIAHFSRVTVRGGDMRIIRSAYDRRKTLVWDCCSVRGSRRRATAKQKDRSE
jgi:hypothetical protein